MLPEMRSFRRQNGAVFTLLATAIAFAGTPAGAGDIDGQIGVASQYVGKGLGKSDGEPSVFGSAEISRGAFYASVFASTAKLSQGSDAEIVGAIGWRPEAAGFDFDLSVVNRDLPGTRAGVDANFWEYQADASRKLGPVTARLRVNYTPDGFAATEEAWWIEGQGSIAVGPRTRASAAYAERSADGGADYSAWNLGVKHKLTDRFALDVRWYDTDSHELGDNYDGRLVGALTVSL